MNHTVKKSQIKTRCTEMYLEPCQLSKMERFAKKKYTAENCALYSQKASLSMFDRVLDTSLRYTLIYNTERVSVYVYLNVCVLLTSAIIILLLHI